MNFLNWFLIFFQKSSCFFLKFEFLFMFVLLTSVHSKWIIQVSFVWAFCCQILLPICYQQNCLHANYVNWELETEMLKNLTFPNLIYFKLKMSTCIAYLSIENDLKKMELNETCFLSSLSFSWFVSHLFEVVFGVMNNRCSLYTSNGGAAYMYIWNFCFCKLWILDLLIL